MPESLALRSGTYLVQLFVFELVYIDLVVKDRIYVAPCLSDIQYGCEVWCLRGDLFDRLRHLHHRCYRTMCRITIAHTIRYLTSSENLF